MPIVGYTNERMIMEPSLSQLIGQTEKALNAILRPILERHELSEPEWVTMRLTTQRPKTEPLPSFVRRRAQYADASSVVDELNRRGLIEADELSQSGQALQLRVAHEITTVTQRLFADLDAADLETTRRVLAQIMAATHAALADS